MTSGAPFRRRDVGPGALPPPRGPPPDDQPSPIYSACNEVGPLAQFERACQGRDQYAAKFNRAIHLLGQMPPWRSLAFLPRCNPDVCLLPRSLWATS